MSHPLFFWLALAEGVIIMVLYFAVKDRDEKLSLKDRSMSRLQNTYKDLDAKRGRLEAQNTELESMNMGLRTTSQEVFEAFHSVGEEIDAYLLELGIEPIEIRTGQEVFQDTSKRLRDKLAIALGPVFQDGTSELTKMALEAASKYDEIRYRLSLYKEQSLASQGRLVIAGKLAPNQLDVAMRGVAAMDETHSKYDHLEGPFKVLGQIVTTAVAQGYVNEIQSILENQDPEALQMVKEILLLSSPDDRKEVDGLFEVIDPEPDGDHGGRSKLGGNGPDVEEEEIFDE